MYTEERKLLINEQQEPCENTKIFVKRSLKIQVISTWNKYKNISKLGTIAITQVAIEVMDIVNVIYDYHFIIKEQAE